MHTQNRHEEIVADQRHAGRMMGEEGGTPHLRRPILRSRLSAKPAKVAPKGHEAYLKALETSGAVVSFEKASSGNMVTGVIKTSDKYTISVQEEAGTRVLFKHDISEFFVTSPAPIAKTTEESV